MTGIVEILGVPIDMLTRTEAGEKFSRLVNSAGQHIVVTPNPEMLVAAQDDTAFLDILRGAALHLADGTGLQFASFLLYGKWPTRISGTDFIDDIARIASQRGWKIFLLGAGEGIAQKTAEVFLSRYPAVKIVGAESGGKVSLVSDGWPVVSEDTLNNIRASSPDILLVAFGHGVQEKWIASHLPQLPSVKVAVGVGGAFDFWSGGIPRAPKWLRAIGMEWLFRLAVEPRRWRRILTALIIFPWLVLKERFGIEK